MSSLRRTSGTLRATLLIAALVLVGVCVLALSASGAVHLGSSATPVPTPLPYRTLMADLPVKVLAVNASTDPTDATKTLVAVQIVWNPAVNHQGGTLALIANDPSGIGATITPSANSSAGPALSLPLSTTSGATGWVSFSVASAIHDGTVIATFTDGSRQDVAIHW